MNVAIIETLPVPIVSESREAFTDELTRILPEHDIRFSIYNAEGSETQASDILRTLAHQSPPDLIVSVATLATRALYQSEEFAHIPKLFMVVSAPVEEGIVPALGKASPRNITGESHVLDAKVKLDMLDGILRAAKPSKPLTVGLVHSTYPSTATAVEKLVALQEQYENINFVTISTPYIKGEEGIITMTDDIARRLGEHAHMLDGYWLSSGPLVEADGLIERVYSEYQLFPLFAESIESVKNGALIGVVSEAQSIGKSAAKKAVLILDNKSANGIPVDKMDNYTVAVNVATAIRLQLPIPSNYLKLSKNHIYH
ncbi:hypothetical protein D210916BOD24_30270 [Alteromonas sp. D210916BOD_24]